MRKTPLATTQFTYYRNISTPLEPSLINLRYLYEFYQAQRARKHDSLHATYLLSGRRRYEEKSRLVHADSQVNGSHDKVPASSPFPSSAPREEEEKPELDVTAITIVKEEDLEGLCCGIFLVL